MKKPRGVGLATCFALAAVVALISALPALAKAASYTKLRNELLAQEIRKLELDNRNASGVQGVVSAYGPLLAGIAAVGAVLGTFINERRNDRRQRDSDRQQRMDESEYRLAERFAAVVTDVGAESESVQAGAAVSLLTFLRPEHQAYHSQVRLVTLANLKVAHSQPVQRLLRHALELALRTEEPLSPSELEFSGGAMEGINLAGLRLDRARLDDADLSNADFTGASLRDAVGNERTVLAGAKLSSGKAHGPQPPFSASLFNARLAGARCAGASFRGANLINAHLEGADLSAASFNGAKLQAAHLEGAELAGAEFDGADVADAYFYEAVFDDAALLSLGKARRLEKAHLSDDAAQRLLRFTTND